MFEADINYLAVLVAAIAAMVLGSIWYAKPVFGARWMKLVGLTDESVKQGAGPAMGIAALSALVTAFVLAHVVDYVNADTVGAGIMTGLWMWVGFNATQLVMNSAFERRNWTLSFINLAYGAVNFAIMGLILAIWA